MTEFTPKSPEELQTLNTRNLLLYYKAERKRFYAYVGRCTCDCCHQFYWEIYASALPDKRVYEAWKVYLYNVKVELDSREDISNEKINLHQDSKFKHNRERPHRVPHNH